MTPRWRRRKIVTVVTAPLWASSAPCLQLRLLLMQRGEDKQGEQTSWGSSTGAPMRAILALVWPPAAPVLRRYASLITTLTTTNAMSSAAIVKYGYSCYFSFRERCNRFPIHEIYPNAMLSPYVQPCRAMLSPYVKPCRAILSPCVQPCHAMLSPYVKPCRAILSPNVQPCHAMLSPYVQPCRAILSPYLQPCHALLSPYVKPCRAMLRCTLLYCVQPRYTLAAAAQWGGA